MTSYFAVAYVTSFLPHKMEFNLPRRHPVNYWFQNTAPLFSRRLNYPESVVYPSVRARHKGLVEGRMVPSRPPGEDSTSVDLHIAMEMLSYRRALALFFYLIALTYLLQWNLRGFNANYSDLHMLTAAKTPAIIALQETKLKAETPCNLHHYKSYRYDLPSVTTAHGGTALLVHYSVPSYSYPLRTGLQALPQQ